MDQGDHAETRSALPIIVSVVSQPGVEHEKGLVPVEDPAQVPDHLLLGRPLLA